MLCVRPFRQGVTEFGCGSCPVCRLKRKGVWTARLMLETQLHEASFFFTLTFDAEHYPDGGSVSVRDVQLFLKRLRASVEEKLRYYAVGEYGEEGGRPHYHVLLFGLRPDRVFYDSVLHRRVCPVVEHAWGKGMIHVGDVTPESAAYCVSYVMKAWTRPQCDALKGRHPEFARMSLKPGIGAGYINEYLGSHKEVAGHVARTGDVPGVVRFSSKVLPLGRYLVGKLREAQGMDASRPEEFRVAEAMELQVALRSVDARKARESVRVQHGKNARRRLKRKGVL